jgi:hypothetical protein
MIPRTVTVVSFKDFLQQVKAEVQHFIGLIGRHLQRKGIHQMKKFLGT